MCRPDPVRGARYDIPTRKGSPLRAIGASCWLQVAGANVVFIWDSGRSHRRRLNRVDGAELLKLINKTLPWMVKGFRVGARSDRTVRLELEHPPAPATFRPRMRV